MILPLSNQRINKRYCNPHAFLRCFFLRRCFGGFNRGWGKNRFYPLMALFVCLDLFSVAEAEERQVILAATEYPPYYGEHLESKGFITEIIFTAFQRVGYDVEVKFLPWKRAYGMAQAGDYDGVYTGWFRKSREQWFEFSDPLPANELGFYALKERNISYVALNDLQPYKIGVVRGYVNPPEFEQARLNTIEVTEDRQNVLSLSRGWIDLVLIDKFMGQYIINTEFPDSAHKFIWLDPPIKVENQYLMFSRKAKNFLKTSQDFNHGLKQLAQEGKIDAIIAKHRALWVISQGE
ncbi:ABC-type amino acid transport/signal transduction systems, periplasmic component/domain [Hahella chejuensis KCTC 2396]|uniref:ABC-type amino acid transport/signal transduction systems, periplasmic component/domain n=2 Tax=Hahella chejuensis TaxID=158327 RepID=Q2SE40_HAHCH|nr:ABC-type amino acid transport/signal transduction systems, periplasmic component/domain [Hahella chejuensis KCTC 2396]